MQCERSPHQQPREQVYRSGLDERGAVDPDRARALVAEYLSSAGAQARYPGLRTAVVASGDRVVVRLGAPLDLPLPLPGVTGEPLVTAESASVVAISN